MNNNIIISENDLCDECINLKPYWFVRMNDGNYRCPECKSVYKKLDDGEYLLIKRE